MISYSGSIGSLFFLYYFFTNLPVDFNTGGPISSINLKWCNNREKEMEHTSTTASATVSSSQTTPSLTEISERPLLTLWLDLNSKYANSNICCFSEENKQREKNYSGWTCRNIGTDRSTCRYRAIESSSKASTDPELQASINAALTLAYSLQQKVTQQSHQTIVHYRRLTQSLWTGAKLKLDFKERGARRYSHQHLKVTNFSCNILLDLTVVLYVQIFACSFLCGNARTENDWWR